MVGAPFRPQPSGLLLGMWLAACGQLEPFEQYLDQTTAVTVSRMSEPLLFYRDEPQLAAHARDYVSLGAIEVNRMGVRSYYLWLGYWSTIDRGPYAERNRAPADHDKVSLRANDRRIELPVFSPEGESIGTVEQVYRHPTPGTRDRYYAVTAEQLRAIAAAEFLRLELDEPAARPYRPWNDDRDSLRSFVEHLLTGSGH